MYSDRFLKAVNFVLLHECAFKKGKDGSLRDEDILTEHDKDDPGGTTRHGIDQRSHPHEDIEHLTLDRAKDIYYQVYWLPSRAEQVPAGYGEVLFDIKVNGGNGPVMLQTALKKNDPSIVIDGDIGPKTLAAMQRQGEIGLENFLLERQERYINLTHKNPNLIKFLRGWINRNNDLAAFVGISLSD